MFPMYYYYYAYLDITHVKYDPRHSWQKLNDQKNLKLVVIFISSLKKIAMEMF